MKLQRTRASKSVPRHITDTWTEGDGGSGLSTRKRATSVTRETTTSQHGNEDGWKTEEFIITTWNVTIPMFPFRYGKNIDQSRINYDYSSVKLDKQVKVREKHIDYHFTDVKEEKQQKIGKKKKNRVLSKKSSNIEVEDKRDNRRGGEERGYYQSAREIWQQVRNQYIPIKVIADKPDDTIINSSPVIIQDSDMLYQTARERWQQAGKKARGIKQPADIHEGKILHSTPIKVTEENKQTQSPRRERWQQLNKTLTRDPDKVRQLKLVNMRGEQENDGNTKQQATVDGQECTCISPEGKGKGYRDKHQTNKQIATKLFPDDSLTSSGGTITDASELERVQSTIEDITRTAKQLSSDLQVRNQRSTERRTKRRKNKNSLQASTDTGELEDTRNGQRDQNKVGSADRKRKDSSKDMSTGNDSQETSNNLTTSDVCEIAVNRIMKPKSTFPSSLNELRSIKHTSAGLTENPSSDSIINCNNKAKPDIFPKVKKTVSFSIEESETSTEETYFEQESLEYEELTDYEYVLSEYEEELPDCEEASSDYETDDDCEEEEEEQESSCSSMGTAVWDEQISYSKSLQSQVRGFCQSPVNNNTRNRWWKMIRDSLKTKKQKEKEAISGSSIKTSIKDSTAEVLTEPPKEKAQIDRPTRKGFIAKVFSNFGKTDDNKDPPVKPEVVEERVEPREVLTPITDDEMKATREARMRKQHDAWNKALSKIQVIYRHISIR